MQLAGAQVVVQGTSLGNVTNADGYYFINNVPVGVRDIVARFLGYRDFAKQHRILAGQTVTVDFGLVAEAVPVDPVVATIEIEPQVTRDKTVSKNQFTGERARALPVDEIIEVVSLGAGTYADEGNFILGFRGRGGALLDNTSLRERAGDFVIRGGRPSESATYVDGAVVSDFDIQRTRTGVGVFAVEEVDVITGGFHAEFGHAQSGIVNIVTREGGETFHGNIRFKTDARLQTDGYDGDERRAFERERCCGFNQLLASAGGPIVPERVTFFGSVEATGAADLDPRAAGFNPAEGEANSNGSTGTILPGNRGDRTRLQAKLTAFTTPGFKMTGTYLYSRDQRERFATGSSINQFLSLATRTKSHDLVLNFDQRILQTVERSVYLQVRGNMHWIGDRNGVPRTPEMAAVLAEALGDNCGAECEVDESTFEGGLLNYRFDDIEFFFEDSTHSTIFGLPPRRFSPLDPIFGQTQIWLGEGYNEGFVHQRERRYGLRVDLDAQLDRVHRSKLGFEWNWINLTKDEGNLGNFDQAESYDVNPRIGAAYAQHRLDYGDLVIDLGLRWDHWDPNTFFPALPGVVNCAFTPFPPIGCGDDAVVVDAPTRNELSPRLGVAHPITDKTQIRLSYGDFHQLPELQHIFVNLTSDRDLTRNRGAFGNPRLEYVKTRALEVGLTHLVSENVVLDLVAYNRDRRGGVRFDTFQQGSISPNVDEVVLPVNADNGNVKGLDLTLSRRFSDLWSADVAYSLQWARGTGSSPADFIVSGFGVLLDPLFPGRRLSPPTEQSPEAFDRTHVINAQFSLQFPDGFQNGNTAGAILRNSGLYIVQSAASGTPYTRTDFVSGFPAEDFRASRLPWTHNTDMRLTKGFLLHDGLALDLFVDIRNVLNIENTVRVYASSGQPDFDDAAGFVGNPRINLEFKEEGAPGGFPIGLDQIRPEFRDAIGRQDLDGNGVITFEEAQESLSRALVASVNSPYNYGEPRQVRFGAEIRF